MDSLKEPLKNWFGYTRRERRSTFILLIIIMIVIALRFSVPERNINIEEISTGFPVSWDGKEVITGIVTDTLKQKKIITGRKQKPLIDLNTCDSASLESLPGIGPVLSARIIKYRKLLGGYASVNQLKEVYGLQEETFDLIAARVFADSMAVRKIKINKADYKELIRLPYFERYEVSAILKYRELKGSITGMNDLTENKLIPAEKVARIRPYLDFGE